MVGDLLLAKFTTTIGGKHCQSVGGLNSRWDVISTALPLISAANKLNKQKKIWQLVRGMRI